MQTQTGNGQTLVHSDSQIRDFVIEEIEYDPLVTTNDIAVMVNDGVVTLAGVVDSYGTRVAAVVAAWRVAGVRDVINNTIVDPKMLGLQTDGEIKIALEERLRKDPLVPEGRVQVHVSDGIVTLRGSVTLHIQREAAKEEAELIPGVRMVDNLIDIDWDSASPRDVTSQINQAFQRNAQVDAADVRVTADGGNVTLAGTVRTYSERQAAEDAAWRAYGVTNVTNNVVIDPF
jgi:osmotically-inducible protein OsmY